MPRIKSVAIKAVAPIKGKYSTRITFQDNQTAEYNLTKAQIEGLKKPHPGRFYNKHIRIKKTPW